MTTLAGFPFVSAEAVATGRAEPPVSMSAPPSAPAAAEPPRASGNEAPVAMKTVLARPPVSAASCAAVPYRSGPANLSTVPAPKPLSWVSTGRLTAAVPPAILTLDGLSLASSAPTMGGRTPACGTRRSGPSCAAATGPAASASGKLVPDATVTEKLCPEYCGWKAYREMAPAVPYRSAPARRVWGTVGITGLDRAELALGPTALVVVTVNVYVVPLVRPVTLAVVAPVVLAVRPPGLAVM